MNQLLFLRNDDLGKLVLRLTVGSLMLFHGASKLMHPDSLGFISGQLSKVGLPEFLTYGVFIGEIVTPIMIVIGILSRLGGLLIFINMLFAIGLVHMHEILSLTKHGGWAIELQAFYLFGGLAIVFLGSGKFAVKPD